MRNIRVVFDFDATIKNDTFQQECHEVSAL